MLTAAAYPTKISATESESWEGHRLRVLSDTASSEQNYNKIYSKATCGGTYRPAVLLRTYCSIVEGYD
jgi:hypothetical protein